MPHTNPYFAAAVPYVVKHYNCQINNEGRIWEVGAKSFQFNRYSMGTYCHEVGGRVICLTQQSDMADHIVEHSNKHCLQQFVKVPIYCEIDGETWVEYWIVDTLDHELEHVKQQMKAVPRQVVLTHNDNKRGQPHVAPGEIARME